MNLVTLKDSEYIGDIIYHSLKLYLVVIDTHSKKQQYIYLLNPITNEKTSSFGINNSIYLQYYCNKDNDFLIMDGNQLHHHNASNDNNKKIQYKSFNPFLNKEILLSQKQLDDDKNLINLEFNNIENTNNIIVVTNGGDGGIIDYINFDPILVNIFVKAKIKPKKTEITVVQRNHGVKTFVLPFTHKFCSLFPQEPLLIVCNKNKYIIFDLDDNPY